MDAKSMFYCKRQGIQVLRLKKALYVLKQSPRAWNKINDRFLNEIEFDKCVCKRWIHIYIRRNTRLLVF